MRWYPRCRFAVLGLKGTMSEAELHILKLNKAKRGDLGCTVPIGYVRLTSGEITLDPDEQVQHVVRLIFRKFDKFDELGTLHALLQYVVRQGIELGVRERRGDTKGRLVWRRPNRQTLQNMLHHPMYAGAYCYGRRHIDPCRKRPGRQSTRTWRASSRIARSRRRAARRAAATRC